MMEKWMAMGILLIHAVAILIFTRGFLLTRTELPFHSKCIDVHQSPCLSSFASTSNHSNGTNRNYQDQRCWTRPVVDRVIIIVLDALRFDFVAPSSFFPEPKPWMDKLQVLQKIAYTKGSTAKIFKAYADPPTTSLQRLKGLTTGGLPTFIDVGNSFGAPAIVEDNFINQLVLNGKRVVMMGDDTWVQLFPNHFAKSYPYPSFNVKDLHTVDNGCIENLLPSLYQDDWDVLIAHFLGVDHAGHIFGVDSVSMIEKLEQYNTVLEKVIQVLESQSEPGGLHESTFLIVMGDHAQTLNGDHGGGTAEEVETAMFAMSFKESVPSIPSEFDTSYCKVNLDRKKICVSSIEQLDFAATLSGLVGVPFPFGSIGRVNPELYSLVSGDWNLDKQAATKEWMENYVNVLCINSWQVKRYVDVYSTSSVIGFSSDDLSKISDLYSQAEKNWSNSIKNKLSDSYESEHTRINALKRQITAYFDFLSSVVELARSKWTEFDLKLMATGFGMMLLSLYIHFLAISRATESYGAGTGISSGATVTFLIVLMRACSFLSNSYILEEGKVANFLLATTGLIKLRFSIIRKTMLTEAVTFVTLVLVLRISIEIGLSKQAATSQFMNTSASWILGISPGHFRWTYATEIVPILSLILLTYVLYKVIIRSSCEGKWKYVIVGSMISYFLIAMHWASESNVIGLDCLLQGIRRNLLPQTIYSIGFGQILLLAFFLSFDKRKNALDSQSRLFIKMVAVVSAFSPTIILLSGKQGPMFALAYLIGGYCIMRLEGIESDPLDKNTKNSSLDSFSVTQWSLLSVCMFFATGHWCAFDGLRYGTAFIGFDEFVLIRQAILLAIETFGFSNILSVFGLPLIISNHAPTVQTKGEKEFGLSTRLFKMYMLYGLLMATSVTATVLCVTIQRRHLMVWGLFAPKFVFDVVGLIITDVLICLAAIYYFD